MENIKIISYLSKNKKGLSIDNLFEHKNEVTHFKFEGLDKKKNKMIFFLHTSVDKKRMDTNTLYNQNQSLIE